MQTPKTRQPITTIARHSPDVGASRAVTVVTATGFTRPPTESRWCPEASIRAQYREMLSRIGSEVLVQM